MLTTGHCAGREQTLFLLTRQCAFSVLLLFSESWTLGPAAPVQWNWRQLFLKLYHNWNLLIHRKTREIINALRRRNLFWEISRSSTLHWVPLSLSCAPCVRDPRYKRGSARQHNAEVYATHGTNCILSLHLYASLRVQYWTALAIEMLRKKKKKIRSCSGAVLASPKWQIEHVLFRSNLGEPISKCTNWQLSRPVHKRQVEIGTLEQARHFEFSVNAIMSACQSC